MFLRARRNELTQRFWQELYEDELAAAPAAMQELAKGDRSVVCDRGEAEASLDWARRHPCWADDPAPVYAHES